MPAAVRARRLSSASFWQLTAPRPADHAALSGPAETDVAVVGAGIAGLSLAVHLAQQGAEVVLAEADVAGAGALGSSAGIVAPQLVRTTPNAVLAALGGKTGPGWLRLIGESGGYLFETIRTLGIACDARSQGFIAPARGARARDRLDRIVAEWRPFRTDLSTYGADETAVLTGCRGYSAAIVDASGGGVDPLRLAHGLAASAVAAGARLFYRSAVVGLDRAGDGWRLRTADGEVLARRVVLCANGGNRALHAALDTSVLPMRVHELTTAPLSAAVLAAMLPGGHSLTDLERDIFSIRVIAGDRLLTYCPVGRDATPATVERAVNRRLQRMLRVYEPVRIENLWEGVAWMNSSLLPRVVRIDEGLWAVQACNGRGIATNVIVGREISRMLLGDGGYRPSIAFDRPQPIRGFALARYLPDMLLKSARLATQVKEYLLRGV